MQGDRLLEEWKEAKETCHKIIQISINSNILRKESSKQTVQQFMKVYDVVYRLCSNKQMEQTRVVMVYKDYKELLKTSLIKMAKNIHQQRDIYKLRMIRRIWDAYDDIMKRLKHMFAYLNRPFHLKQGKLDDLDRTGMVIICTSLFTQQALLQYESIYFKEILKIRQYQDYTDSTILKQFVQILYKIHLKLIKKENKKIRTLYTQFQQKYLAEAKQFYITKFNVLKQFSPSQYFIEVNNFYEIQSKLSQECFGDYNISLINKLFAEQFLQNYRETLISNPKGLKQILQHREANTIKIITDIYKKLTDSINGFKEPFEAFIYEEITSLIIQYRLELLNKKSSQAHVNFIQKIINKNNQLVQILENSFMKFSQFLTYYKSGVEKAFSKNPLQTPIEQILVTYIIARLKNTFSEDDRTQQIMNIIRIFSCLENKDLFLFKYIQQLSRKIIILSDQGLANHEKFINYMKMDSGNKFTERLQMILYENKESKENTEELRRITEKEKLPIRLNLWMFSEGVWPNQDIFDIPQELFPQPLQLGQKCVRTFEQQIVKKKTLKISYLDSKVRWIYYFQKQTQNKLQECYFDTNCLQAALLFYIYQRRPQRVSLKVIEQVFNTVKPQLIKYFLNLMASVNEKILIQSVFENQEFYEFNRLMKSKKKLINYDLSLDGIEEEKLFQNKSELNRDREATVDANIAKFMKSKKVISFDKLCEEIIKMIKVFTPSMKDIKNSVERLLSKDILMRDEKQKTILKYKN